MQTHMSHLPIIAAAALVLVVSGCGKDPNPLIGKWKLAAQSENNLACIGLVEIEFTEKTVTTGLGPTKGTFTVTYDRAGDSYLASIGNGLAFKVKIESGGIEVNGCHLVSARGDALRAASAEGHLDMVQALLAEGADVNAKDNKGVTPLMVASFNGHLDIVQALLAKGADVDAKDNNDARALHFASLSGHHDIVQALLAKGADVNARVNDGTTALLGASAKGHLDIVQALLAKGADVNAKNNNGITALIAASHEGHLDIVQALLAKGADVNATANNGMTALKVATEGGHPDIVQVLLAKGTGANARVNEGTSVAHLPRQFIGKWYLPSSFHCDYRLANIELTETSMTVAIKIGFRGELDSHTIAVTYSRDGEFYAATPAAGNGLAWFNHGEKFYAAAPTAGTGPALRFKFNRPDIVLDSGCVLAPPG